MKQGSTRNKMIRLSRAEQRKVEDYLKEHWATICTEKTSRDEIVGRIASELQIITTKHVLNGCARAIELGPWPHPITERSGTGGANTRRKQVMFRLLCLWAEKAGKEFGFPVPKEIADYNELSRVSPLVQPKIKNT